jgi:hypothetical protein
MSITSIMRVSNREHQVDQANEQRANITYHCSATTLLVHGNVLTPGAIPDATTSAALLLLGKHFHEPLPN